MKWKGFFQLLFTGRLIVLFLAVAAALPAQFVMPGGTEPMFETFEPIRHTGKNLVCTDPDAAKCAALWLPNPTPKQATLPAQITVSATHQPPAALASQTGRVSKGIAVYEVVACGSGTISTAEIRQRFARQRLQLLAPVLGTVTAERERARGVLGVISSIPDLAPLAALALSTSGAPGAAKIGGAAVSAIVAGWHAAHSPRPVPFLDKGVITLTGGCESYLAYAYWPRRGGIQSVEFTRVQ